MVAVDRRECDGAWLHTPDGSARQPGLPQYSAGQRADNISPQSTLSSATTTEENRELRNESEYQ